MRRLIGLFAPLCFLATAYVPSEAADATAEAVAKAQVQASAALSRAGEGRRLYLKLNCYGCHGMAGEGGIGPRLAGHAEDVSEAVLRGKEGGMPAFSAYVTATDVTNLTLYLRSIGTPSEPKFNDWWVALPPK